MEPERVRAAALPLTDVSDLDPLVERVGDARVVLVGEASHGTHEFYTWRAALTRRLIDECGFAVVAVEADAPDGRQIDRSVRLADAQSDPGDVLAGMREWPSWMWANAETVAFCRWLRAHNARLPATRRVGWYGLDGYPLWAATRTIVDHLRQHRPQWVNRSLDGNAEGGSMVPEDLVEPVIELLVRRQREVWSGDDPGRTGIDLADGAEAFFRALVSGGVRAWNARDEHWSQWLEAIMTARGPDSRAVVWAHNTHIGDARATDMAQQGMVNLGRLVRERRDPADVVAVGFAGGAGRVIAAAERGGPMDAVTVPTPVAGSLEALLADAGTATALFVFGATTHAVRADWADLVLGHRAIGVVYDPALDAERYVPTRPARRYDALMWFTHTTPVRALHLDASRRGELPLLRLPNSAGGR